MNLLAYDTRTQVLVNKNGDGRIVRLVFFIFTISSVIKEDHVRDKIRAV